MLRSVFVCVCVKQVNGPAVSVSTWLVMPSQTSLTEPWQKVMGSPMLFRKLFFQTACFNEHASPVCLRNHAMTSCINNVIIKALHVKWCSYQQLVNFRHVWVWTVSSDSRTVETINRLLTRERTAVSILQLTTAIGSLGAYRKHISYVFFFCYTCCSAKDMRNIHSALFYETLVSRETVCMLERFKWLFLSVQCTSGLTGALNEFAKTISIIGYWII